jgi:hypothetical protein
MKQCPRTPLALSQSEYALDAHTQDEPVGGNDIPSIVAKQ